MMSGSSRGPPAVDLLWAYQLKKEHAHLKAELSSVKEKILATEHAAGVANAATREVDELRKHLDDYMNDPEEIQRNTMVSNMLGKHAKQLTSFNSRLDALSSRIGSSEDDLDRLDGKWNAHELRWKRFEERMEKSELSLESLIGRHNDKAQSERMKTLEIQVNRLTEHITKTTDLHSVEIDHLKQALIDLQKSTQKTESTRRVTQKPLSPQIQVPQSPNLSSLPMNSLLSSRLNSTVFLPPHSPRPKLQRSSMIPM
ncbi:unnamed protein product [Periconia digitata]|uniref:Uncharacterized protein n=1 Tax=Periconia digitata TaxID=1303443 RepID=A0A9W4U686_9PLEO|nr:unnamed protein product [Periconia digitata]